MISENEKIIPDSSLCPNDLKEFYNVHGGKINYITFEGIVVRFLNQYAPIKEKYIRAL